MIWAERLVMFGLRIAGRFIDAYDARMKRNDQKRDALIQEARDVSKEANKSTRIAEKLNRELKTDIENVKEMNK